MMTPEAIVRLTNDAVDLVNIMYGNINGGAVQPGPGHPAYRPPAPAPVAPAPAAPAAPAPPAPAPAAPAPAAPAAPAAAPATMTNAAQSAAMLAQVLTQFPHLMQPTQPAMPQMYPTHFNPYLMPQTMPYQVNPAMAALLMAATQAAPYQFPAAPVTAPQPPPSLAPAPLVGAPAGAAAVTPTYTPGFTPTGAYDSRDYDLARRSLSKPPRFTGETSFSTFLLDLQNHISLANLPPEFQVRALRDAFENGGSEAKAFALYMKNSRRFFTLSFNELVAEAKGYFDKGKNSQQVLEKLMYATQTPTESLEAWYNRVMALRQEAINQGEHGGASPDYINDFATHTFLKGLVNKNVSNTLLIAENYPKNMRELYHKVHAAQMNIDGAPRQAAVGAVSTAPTDDILADHGS